MRRCPPLLLWLAAASAALAGEGAPEPPFAPATGLEALRGDVRPLPDGRLELYYDWTDPAQLADWRVVAGPEPQVAEGELCLGSEESHTLRHAAAFLGAVEVAGTCRIREGLGVRGHVGVALCAAPWRGYWLLMRDGEQALYREDASPAFLGIYRERLRDEADHAFHFARQGNLAQAWLDRTVHLRGRDAAHHQGSVVLRAWRVRAGLRGVWLLGRPEAQWLAANPGVARQLEALGLYAGGVAALRPLWETCQHAAALAKAKALVAEEPYAKSPVAAKWTVADAQALADLWQAAEAGAGTLKPGDVVRAGGAEGTFQRREDALLIVRVGDTELPKKLASFQGEELLALAARARAGGRTRPAGPRALAPPRRHRTGRRGAGRPGPRPGGGGGRRAAPQPRHPEAPDRGPGGAAAAGDGGEGGLRWQAALHRGRGGGDASGGAGGGEGRDGLGRPLRVGAAGRGRRAVWQALLARRLPRPRAAAHHGLPMGARAVALVGRQLILLRGRPRGRGEPEPAGVAPRARAGLALGALRRFERG